MAHVVACVPPSLPANPYLTLLYGALRERGVEQAETPDLSLRALRAGRGRVCALHLHWPEPLYRFERGPAAVRRTGSWLKLLRFLLRLAAARMLGYRIVWTVHQVLPHERTQPRLDAAAAVALARLAHVLVAHDRDTAAAAERELHAAPAKLRIVPHGSYLGVYPPGRPREEVRRALGLAPEAFVLLAFGELRAHKGVDLLLDAFARVRAPSLALLVAGHPRDAAVAALVDRTAAADRRVRPLLRLVPDGEVAELHGAADAVVVTRTGGTSGSLVLALSLGLPVIAPDIGAYRELAGPGAGWLYAPGEAAALAAALASAAADAAEARRRGRRALEAARRLHWDGIAAELAPLLTGEAA